MKNLAKSVLMMLFCVIAKQSVATEVSVDLIKKQLEAAHSQYLSGDQQKSVNALEQLAKLLQYHQSPALDSQIGPNNLAYTYLRLGVLYEKSGDTSKATSYFSKALLSYKGDKVELEQLKTQVQSLDRHSL